MVENKAETSPSRKRHVRLAPEVKAAVREDFERGRAVASLAEHYGVNRSTIYKWADKSAWRRPEPAPMGPLAAEDEGWADAEAADGALALEARRVAGAAVRALRAGRRAAAAEQLRLVDLLLRLEARLSGGGEKGEIEKTGGRGGWDARPFVAAPDRDLDALIAERFGIDA